jgi:predicted nucleic acid-binding protein
MDRLLLDANVLFSAAYMADARLRELWRLRDVELWTSRYALEEARVNLSDEAQRERLLDSSEPLQFHEAGEPTAAQESRYLKRRAHTASRN